MHISLKVMQLVTTDWTFELCLGSLSFCMKPFSQALDVRHKASHLMLL